MKAVDIDQVFIEQARSHSKAEEISNIDFRLGDIYALDFPGQTFDLTRCKFVLPRMKDPAKGVSELVRVTKSDGHVATMDEGDLYVYPPGSLDEFFGLFEKLGQNKDSKAGTS